MAADASGQPPIPDGFEQVARAPFVNHVGPILQAIDDPPGEVRLGIWVAPVHTNTLGLMHGGMISTVIDSAMARALISKLHRRSVTLKMSVEFLEAVKLGDWVVATGRLDSHDGKVGFTSCEVRVGDALKVRASGVFRLLKPISA
ncbi:MAG: PaaI family thioesterase [Hyphomonadaceae bacterium]